MNKTIKSQLLKLDKKELKLLNKTPGLIKQKLDPVLYGLEQKIPEGLRETLEKAFEKAFKLVFEKGTGFIEKVTPRDNIAFEHEMRSFAFKNDKSLFSKARHLKRMDKMAGKRSVIGKSVAFAEGAGLGILGIGIPDIPVFISVLLKGIYEIALSYGFDYNKPEERLYILKLIQAATAEDFDKQIKNLELNNWEVFLKNCSNPEAIIEAEIKNTAAALSNYMLVCKFIQGLPIIGVTGSIFNLQIYSKISDYAELKYKRRYLQKL